MSEDFFIMRAKGTTELVTECDCCGRVDLKKTVIMAVLDADGNETDRMHFGVVCAAKASGRPVKEIKAEASAADSELAREWSEALNLNRAFNTWRAGQDREAVIAERKMWVFSEQRGRTCYLHWTENAWGRYMTTSFNVPSDYYRTRPDLVIDTFVCE
jgi:hypothetical protein